MFFFIRLIEFLNLILTTNHYLQKNPQKSTENKVPLFPHVCRNSTALSPNFVQTERWLRKRKMSFCSRQPNIGHWEKQLEIMDFWCRRRRRRGNYVSHSDSHLCNFSPFSLFLERKTSPSFEVGGNFSEVIVTFFEEVLLPIKSKRSPIPLP